MSTGALIALLIIPILSGLGAALLWVFFLNKVYPRNKITDELTDEPMAKICYQRLSANLSYLIQQADTTPTEILDLLPIFQDALKWYNPKTYRAKSAQALDAQTLYYLTRQRIERENKQKVSKYISKQWTKILKFFEKWHAMTSGKNRMVIQAESPKFPTAQL